MAGLTEKQQDNEYCRKHKLGRNALKPEKTLCKLKCPSGHKIKTIRAFKYVQVECDLCDVIISFGPGENDKGHKRVMGCETCNFHLCAVCFELNFQNVRY